jgi:hypothetical protein
VEKKKEGKQKTVKIVKKENEEKKKVRKGKKEDEVESIGKRVWRKR